MEKNSEDEDGQLEEQIERLQEKVESAQSEQKNLFLVIFQVGPAPGSGSYVTNVRHTVDVHQLHVSQCVEAWENYLKEWNFVLHIVLKTASFPESVYISLHFPP